jgi:Tfp pilus assembly protein PilW
MLALLVGLVLIASFLFVLQRSRRDFAAGESLAALQDSARHALLVLADDVEHAGFFGFARGRVQLVRGGMVVAEDDALFQPGTAAVPPVPGLPSGAHDCGVNFAVDLLRPVQAADNHFELGTAASDCTPTSTAGGAAARADTLTVRHASLAASVPRPGRVQLYSSALAQNGPLVLFADGLAPGPIDVDHEVRDLEVRSYYIANDSVGRRGWPALRVKALTESRGAAQFRDEEVMPGVEDLQVELLVASRGGGGGESLQRALPGSASAATGRVVAVRLWLRVRADSTESGFHDDQVLRYANTEFVPGAAEARQRRLLVQRTVALRNAGS